MLDYIFSHLGINTEGSVEHPVVMTEPVCNPGYCRESKCQEFCEIIPEQVLFFIYSVLSIFTARL